LPNPPNDKMPERLNIRTIARVAKVSISTVSRAMNHVSTVNPRTAKRVRKVIEELDYLPNTQARALVSKRSRLFGLIVSDIANPFFLELIQGFEQTAIENGYEILVSSTSYDPKRRSHCIHRMLQRKAEGIAVMTFGVDEPLLDKLTTHNVPLVFADARLNQPDILSLKIDYHRGIRQGIQHLAALGHRRISFISGPRETHTAESRRAAFFSSVQECGIVPNASWVVEGDHTVKGGIVAMDRLLTTKSRPTAVICSNDMTAIGVLHKMHRVGLRVPDDLSVIGFDDIHVAEVSIPPLTTIRLSRLELARAAVMALRMRVETSKYAVQESEYKVQTNLVIRESTTFPQGTMTHLRKAKECPAVNNC
jgi:DNA-binding LacI/PurR family transcriptional regulator